MGTFVIEPGPLMNVLTQGSLPGPGPHLAAPDPRGSPATSTLPPTGLLTHYLFALYLVCSKYSVKVS